MRVRLDLPKHERQFGGVAGVDTLKTLQAWKQRPHWYRQAEPGETGIKMGEFAQIVPLKTLPRENKNLNVFIGASATYLSEVINTIPLTPGSAGLVAISLLRNARHFILSLEPSATFTLQQAHIYLSPSRRFQLPKHSKAFVDKVAEIFEIVINPPYHAPKETSWEPYFLFAPERIFQKVAIAEVLLSLGMDEAFVIEAFEQLGASQGFTFGDYRAWSDTDHHGLQGWRDSTVLPSRYKPDLVVLEQSTKKRLLVDAKLRQGSSPQGLLSSSGLKDLQAYMQEYSLSRAVMLVPDSRRESCRYEDVKNEEFWVRSVAIPLHSFSSHQPHIKAYLYELWN